MKYPSYVKCIKLIVNERIEPLIELGEIYQVTDIGKIIAHNGDWICDYGSINGDNLFKPCEPNPTAKVLKNL